MVLSDVFELERDEVTERLRKLRDVEPQTLQGTRTLGVSMGCARGAHRGGE